MHIVQYNIDSICYRNVFTNVLPCSHTINPNNENVSGDLCSITDVCYMAYVRTVFPLNYPSTGYEVQYMVPTANYMQYTQYTQCIQYIHNILYTTYHIFV